MRTLTARQEENQGNTPDSTAEQLLREGEQRFQEAVSQNQFGVAHVGFFEAACVVNPPLSRNEADQRFLEKVMAVHPGLADWPLWFDTRVCDVTEFHPYKHQEGWECRISDVKIQFWRMEPIGRFYVKASFEEDKDVTVDAAQARPELNARWRIRRVIEATKCCLAFARELDAGENTSLEFAFRWTRLQGRVLRRHPLWPIPGAGPSQRDVLESSATLHIAAGSDAIIDAARHALAPLFELFRIALPRAWVEKVYSDFWRLSS